MDVRTRHLISDAPDSVDGPIPVTEACLSSFKEVQLPREAYVSILWIILIVVLVLALLGFVGR
jgi:hypothetical protein